MTRKLGRGLVVAPDAGMGVISKANRGVTTDVLELLTTQHEEVDALMENLENDVGDRAAQFQLLADNLAAHATVEEKIFYPAVMAKSTNEMLHESVEEHLSVKRILADMLQMRMDEDTFKAKLSVLKEQVSHHAHEEEEEKLFAKVRQMFSKDELAALGNEVLAMFATLMTSRPSDNVPAETTAAAPLPAVSN